MRFFLRIPFLARDTQPPSIVERFFAATNAEREKAGLTPYWWNERGARVAQARCDDMVTRDYFSHTTPDGIKGYTEELARQGVTTFRWAGENLTANNYPASEAVERAMVTLMNSPTHRANILDVEFESCGIGYALRPTGVHLFVSIFLAGVGP